MTIEYRFEENSNCLLIRAFEEITYDQYSTFVEAVTRLENVPAGHLRLTDARDATGVPEYDAIRALAHRIDQLDEVKPPKRAAIVANKDWVFGSARVFLAWRNAPDQLIGLYRNVDEAIRWLEFSGSSGDPFSPQAWSGQPHIRIE